MQVRVVAHQLKARIRNLAISRGFLGFRIHATLDSSDLPRADRPLERSVGHRWLALSSADLSHRDSRQVVVARLEPGTYVKTRPCAD